MATTIRKWGNSLGLRIPRKTAEDLGLVEGKEVLLEKRGGELAVVPLKKMPPSLDSLVRAITPRNRQSEVSWGTPRGKEVW